MDTHSLSLSLEQQQQQQVRAQNSGYFGKFEKKIEKYKTERSDARSDRCVEGCGDDIPRDGESEFYSTHALVLVFRRTHCEGYVEK